ncbi:flagellar hook-basal body complex protein [Periweissella fabaria]|uniref:Flagellar basal-body rod protein FlgG n=1 Tax=Periweissella fabaria TaxID=546157 RepID=A0ABM8Z7Z9_9LACO|nr:flagellar hook-basal body complex protein [Periweissella fabaria]MCM0597027.1 flagellar hook-basal body complex protein [Periweissella fabaria]CAH0416982.1 Flagellar basal-body rod protein FlgG [Periweissella fabaria]
MIRALDTLQNNFDLLIQRQANLASNIANANTPGYMEQNLFQSTLREVRLHNYQGGKYINSFNDAGGFTFGNELSGSRLNTNKGAMKTTGLQTDFAIPTAGFFNIQMPNGQTAYTRNGNFRLNDQNQLVTQDGYAVLGQNGQPIVGTDNPPFKITNFANISQLANLGNTYYTSPTPGTTVTTQVQAGMLEQSNVQIADQMTSMIQISREYEANQRALSMNNATLDKAVNRLGAL